MLIIINVIVLICIFLYITLTSFRTLEVSNTDFFDGIVLFSL